MLETYEQRAADTVKGFLTEFSKKISMRLKMTQFYNMSKRRDANYVVIHAQKKFIKHMNLDKARVNLLSKYWNDTKEKLVLQMIKAKKEGKKLKAFQSMSNEMRDATLARYYQKCKRKHNFTYFEWRRKR